MDRNEKVVHTRVSKELYDKISSKAKKHRISTSNLLRNLVEDYIEIHGDVWDAIDKKLKTYIDSGEDTIIGYQPLSLSKSVKCSLCGKTLKKGAEAFIGYFEKSSQKVVVCSECKDKEENE